MNLSAAYALAGKMEEAKAALAEARRVYPVITVTSIGKYNPPPLYDGLRKAGLPEE
jgi:hypothetical protein